MGKRGTTSCSAVDQLQVALTRSLKESVADTVSYVCGSFQKAVKAQAASIEAGGGYDQYYTTCRRLVDYIAQHMETSPDFDDQMDRIILACHSGATKRVLNSVVTQELWFRRREAAPRDTCSSSSAGRVVRRKEIKRDSASAKIETVESPVMLTRSASGSKRTTRSCARDTQPVKKPRRAARQVLVENSIGNEEEREEDGRSKSGRALKVKQYRREEDDDDALLSFEDAIGEMCNPDRRTPSETKFFKERLRKSIQFVDALLCNPPSGKVCGRGCKRIRAQMCSSSTPCKNKMCRIWHDVEAHTDRCQNVHCEFKNRILLRELMHKLEMKEQQIAAAKTGLESKQTELTHAAEKAKETIKKDIVRLDRDCKECERELSVLKAAKKTLWSTLNNIGITVRDDLVDEFPDFAAHYVKKKALLKARRTMAASSTLHSSASSQSSRATSRRVSVGPHRNDGDGNDDTAHTKSVNGSTGRRSTSSGRRSPFLEHESVEETMGNMKELRTENDLKKHDRSDSPLPLPPGGPPPIRQNPELNCEYSTSASGYSIHPPANEFEASAVAANIELAKIIQLPAENGLTDVQLADMQRASDEITGIIAGISTDLPPVDALSTTALIIREIQPQDS